MDEESRRQRLSLADAYHHTNIQFVALFEPRLAAYRPFRSSLTEVYVADEITLPNSEVPGAFYRTQTFTSIWHISAFTMKACLAITTIFVLPAVLARPIPFAGLTSNDPFLTARGFFGNIINGAKGKGLGGNQQQAVTGAASSFAGDVATVSASLNGMGNATDAATVRTLARKAYVAEKDEDQHRAVLNGAASGGARAANQKIVDNTPIVLNGLLSIMANPGMGNTMQSLSRIERAR